jgi:hypothetical protein
VYRGRRVDLQNSARGQVVEQLPDSRQMLFNGRLRGLAAKLLDVRRDCDGFDLVEIEVTLVATTTAADATTCSARATCSTAKSSLCTPTLPPEGEEAGRCQRRFRVDLGSCRREASTKCFDSLADISSRKSLINEK